MNPNKDKALVASARRSPFGVCLVVFLLLACDYGLRLWTVIEQRQQLEQARLKQAQNLGVLVEAQQVEARVEALSMDLLQLARTNAAAKQIVQNFNIQWTPGPTATPALALATNLPGNTAPNPAPTNLPK